MQKFADFVATVAHHLKPVMRDGSQFAGMLPHPRIDGWIALDSIVESHNNSDFMVARVHFEVGWIAAAGTSRVPARSVLGS